MRTACLESIGFQPLTQTKLLATDFAAFRVSDQGPVAPPVVDFCLWTRANNSLLDG
jgi:hypothetical protein